MGIEVSVSLDSEAVTRTLAEGARWVGSRNAARTFATSLAVGLRKYRRQLRAVTPKQIDSKRTDGEIALHKRISINSKITTRGTAIAQIGYNIRKTASRPGQRVSKVLGLEYGNRHTPQTLSLIHI